MAKKTTTKKQKLKCKLCRRSKEILYFYVKNQIKRPKKSDTLDVCAECHSIAIEKGYKKVGFNV